MPRDHQPNPDPNENAARSVAESEARAASKAPTDLEAAWAERPNSRVFTNRVPMTTCDNEGVEQRRPLSGEAMAQPDRWAARRLPPLRASVAISISTVATFVCWIYWDPAFADVLDTLKDNYWWWFSSDGWSADGPIGMRLVA